MPKTNDLKGNASYFNHAFQGNSSLSPLGSDFYLSQLRLNSSPSKLSALAIVFSIASITHDMGVIAEFAHRVVVMYAGRKVEEGPVREIINNPQHPYTQGLLRCVPHLKTDPGPDREELMEIPGVVPHLSQLGDGCPFAPRCEHATSQCNKKIPHELEVGTDRRVSCWLSGGTK